jgi:hypothetical protein
MMNNPTLSKEIIYHSVDRANSTKLLQSERSNQTHIASELKIVVPQSMTLQPDPASPHLSQASRSFFDVERESEREYNNYLLEFLTGILTGFADRFVISKKTIILLSALLTSFLSQPDVRSCYPIAKYRNTRRGKWKDRLSIVDFIDFLNNERINCDSPSQCGELSKLISCFKIFILNDLISSLLTPIRLDADS